MNKTILKTLLLGLFSLVIMASSGVLHAQKKDEPERKFDKVKTTRVKAMSSKLAKKITPARECLSPAPEKEGAKAPEPNPNCAIRILKKVSTTKLPGHEKAEVWNLFAYAYYLTDNIPSTKNYYMRVVNEPEANAPLRTRTLKTVSQLCMMEEDYRCALKYFQEWMSLQSDLGAPDYALLATIYYNKNDKSKALVNIERAISMRESAGRLGKESWYSIQRAVYREKKNNKKVVQILQKVIVNFPKVRYWRELGGMYSEMEAAEKQLGAFSIAYLQGGLNTESLLVGMAYMYIAADVPYKGAEILIKALKEKKIEETEKNLQLIGSALYQASELKKALPWMEKAAEKSDKGESYSRLAGIYLDLGRHKDALRTASQAIKLGGVKRMDLAYLTKGTAQFNLKRYSSAIKTFKKIDDKRTKKSRDQWIKYVNNEKKREQQIIDSGINLKKVLGRS